MNITIIIDIHRRRCAAIEFLCGDGNINLTLVKAIVTFESFTWIYKGLWTGGEMEEEGMEEEGMEEGGFSLRRESTRSWWIQSSWTVSRDLLVILRNRSRLSDILFLVSSISGHPDSRRMVKIELGKRFAAFIDRGGFWQPRWPVGNRFRFFSPLVSELLIFVFGSVFYVCKLRKQRTPKLDALRGKSLRWVAECI